MIDKLPVIEQYSKDGGEERETDYVFSSEAYSAWIETSPEPLRSASILASKSGICRGEMLQLMRDCVHLYPEPQEKTIWGRLFDQARSEEESSQTGAAHLFRNEGGVGAIVTRIQM